MSPVRAPLLARSTEPAAIGRKGVFCLGFKIEGEAKAAAGVIRKLLRSRKRPR